MSCLAAALLAVRAWGLRDAAAKTSPCVELLVDAARACRSEQRPFSITDFVAVPEAELGVVTSPDRTDVEAGAAINASFPGLQVLDALQHVYLVDGFLSPTEAGALLQAGDFTEFLPSVMRASQELLLDGRAERDRTCTGMLREATPCARVGHRNSSTLALYEAEDSVRLVRDRIARLLPGLVRGHCLETIALTRYRAGGFYSNHADGRRATVLIYLGGEEDAVGGATFFPHLGLRVPPLPGRALVFFPTFADGERKAEMIHAAEELQAGEKYIVQQWIDIPGQRDCTEESAGWGA